MCALFVMHKQEVAEVGRVGDGGEGRRGGRGWGSIPISILLHSAMQMRLWVSVALSCFLK